MNELDRIRKLAGILTESVMAVPGVGSESNMQTVGNAACGANYAAFDASQPQVDEAYDHVGFITQSIRDNHPVAMSYDALKARVGRETGYTNNPDYNSLFKKAYIGVYGSDDSGDVQEPAPEDDYTDYSMRQGEMGMQGSDTPQGNRAWGREQDRYNKMDEAAPDISLEIQSALEMLEELENNGVPHAEIIDSIESSFRADGFSDEEITGVLTAVQQHIENPPEDEEAGYCTSCNGSGEGMYDGSRCSSCGGSGMERGDSDDFDDPVDEYDPADDIYEESFDLNNGYTDIDFMAPGDFFPDGADSPVTSRVGPSGARMGDNPEQKKMAVAETHKELVYNYRKFLEESAKN